MVDVNGDGHLDLVQALWRMPNNSGDVGASVYLNRGDGTFATALTYAADIQAQSIAAADFNGDGRPDLALLNGIYDLDILINQGDGRFAPFVNRAAPPSAVVMAAADLDGDGRMDLAVTTQNHALATVTIALSSSPTAFAAGDLNHDGISDLAVILDDNATGVILSTCELGL
jgi:hypothetical protein